MTGTYRCIHLSSERWEPGQETQPLLSSPHVPARCEGKKRDQANSPLERGGGDAARLIVAAERNTNRESGYRKRKREIERDCGCVHNYARTRLSVQSTDRGSRGGGTDDSVAHLSRHQSPRRPPIREEAKSRAS
jgi:hypothetical protein